MKIIFDNEEQKDKFMRGIRKMNCPHELGLTDKPVNYCRGCLECWNDVVESYIKPQHEELQTIHITIQDIAKLLSGETLVFHGTGRETIELKFNKESVNNANQN